MKKKTEAQLKRELDKLVSLYVRQYWANDEGMVACYTCHKTGHWKSMHCGHYIPRNVLITRWNENNLRPQCVGCNMFGNGKPLDFEERLKREIGEKEVEQMKASRHKVFKVDRIWYEEQIEIYTKKLEEL